MAIQPKHPGLLIVLCGPSGVGKSTISRDLAEKYSVSYIVSATTRPKREGDDKGKGGVRLTKSPEEAGKEAGAMLGHVLITKQTGPKGREVELSRGVGECGRHDSIVRVGFPEKEASCD